MQIRQRTGLPLRKVAAQVKAKRRMTISDYALSLLFVLGVDKVGPLQSAAQS